MAEENKRPRKFAINRLQMGRIFGLLQKIWMVVFTAAKVAVGAVATVLLIGIVCGFVFVGILGDYLQNDVMPMASVVLEDYDMDTPSKFFYVNENGDIEVLQTVFAVTSWQEASIDEMPDAMLHAAVAIEDKRFYEHQGVDWFTTIKAVANMFFGDTTVGGSSITQQLVKNVTGRDSVTVQRKVLEFFDAVYVEKRYDKDVILQAYLNTIYMGQGCNGVKSAAAAYFGKELQTLTIAECACLISITNNPSMFDPYSTNEFMYKGEMMNGMQRNRYRQLLVLEEMRSQGWITQEEYDEAVAQEIVLKRGIDDDDRWTVCSNESCGYENIRSTYVIESGKYFCPQCRTEATISEDASQSVYSWFVDAALEDVAKALAEKDGIEWNDAVARTYKSMLSRNGYNIYTTLDMRVQNQVDKIYEDLSQIPETYSAQQLQSGIVVIDNRTGDIVAMFGGVGEKTVHDAFSMAVDAKRQAGSSIKPLTVYGPAFETGEITPATVVKDMPYQYDENGKPYPNNESRTFAYAQTIRSAIMESANTVSVNTLDMIGTGYGFTFGTEKFRLSTLLEKYTNSSGGYSTDNNIASLALGANLFGVTVRDMANAFATFANNGVYREARTFTKVYDSEGNLVLDNVQESEQILSQKAVAYTNYCLVSTVSEGTGVSARINGLEVAGKTGTSTGNKDRWFCGYTGYYTAAVWCGYETPEQINLVGVNLNPAGQLWKKVMQPLHSGKTSIELYDRSQMVDVTVCLDSGKLATDACTSDIRASSSFSRVETVKVFAEDVPAETCDKHIMLDYCTTGKGIANEYCKRFAAVDASVALTKCALVKMTDAEVAELLKVEQYGLETVYLRDDYIYLTDSTGADMVFHGIHGDVTNSAQTPYLGCTVHTKAGWEAYEAAHPTEPSTPETPTEPENPDNGNSGNFWDDWWYWINP